MTTQKRNRLPGLLLGFGAVRQRRQERSRGASGPGFTLIELLVVVGVIALLAGLLAPALMKAWRKSHQTDCSNNLHQFSVACQLYRMHHGDQWPPWLSSLYPTYVNDQVAYLCVADNHEGKVGGKPPELIQEYSGNYFDETDDTISNDGSNGALAVPRNDAIKVCSYFYEMCAVECSWGWANHLGISGDAVEMAKVDANNDGIETWGEVKAYQLVHGDDANGKVGYDEIYFPVIRCFHHYRDRKILVDDPLHGRKKEGLTLNVAYAGNVFQSPITWELKPVNQ